MDCNRQQIGLYGHMRQCKGSLAEPCEKRRLHRTARHISGDASQVDLTASVSSTLPFECAKQVRALSSSLPRSAVQSN